MDLIAFGINADQWTTAEQGGVAQDGGTRGGTFRGEVDGRCTESADWTTACRSMPERDGKDQGEDSP